MAMLEKNLKNVTISLEDQLSVDDEMLTVSFNQCSGENRSTANETSNPSQTAKTESTETTEEDKTDSRDSAEVSNEEQPITSASQYFVSETTPKRNRTTSDNEFFDHLIAGDSAMMCDENVGETITADLSNTVVEQSSIAHCNSAAELNVTATTLEKSELSYTDENQSKFDSQAENDAEKLNSKTNEEESQNNILNAFQEQLTSETIPENKQDQPDSSSVAKVKENENEEIPVFRYFAQESNAPTVESNSAFDDFSSLTNAVNNVPEADAFSAAIEESELNRRRDAWIPSHSTTEYLKSYVESPSGAPDRFTNPKIILKNILTDPISTLMTTTNVDERLFASRKSNILTEKSVPANESGLRRLMEMGCHRAAINLTAILITTLENENSKLSPQLLQLWFCRIGLLIKVKLFNEAYEEGQAFAPNLDNPDMYYKFYPDMFSGREGSMVSFGFRLLLAELPRYIGNYQEALGRLYALLNIVEMIIKNLEKGLGEDGSNIEISESNRKASLDLWRQRELNVIYSLVNAVTCHKDYTLAVRLISNLIGKESDERKLYLWSSRGRIYLQLGDIAGAQESFSLATSSIPSGLKDDKEIMIMELNNKAMLAVAQNHFHEAYKFYKTASDMDPSNPTLKNNMAVCLLYIGEMQDSLINLEQDIKNDPANFLHEGILFNVCTLYELESSHSSYKKINMLALTSQHKGDSFNTACLKIS